MGEYLHGLWQSLFLFLGSARAASRRALPAQNAAWRVDPHADRERIIDTINRLFIGTDQRDWESVKTLFAPKVAFDMTSLAGGTPSILSPEEIVDSWDRGLKMLKAIHHQAGNHLVSVTGNEATAFCYAIASHYLPTRSGRNTRTFVGSYDFHLVKSGGDWRIDRFTFNLKYIDGNRDLETDQEAA